jgi:hypothetical protein
VEYGRWWGRKMAKKGRFLFGKDLSDGEIVDAIVQMAKEHRIPFNDNRKGKKKLTKGLRTK